MKMSLDMASFPNFSRLQHTALVALWVRCLPEEQHIQGLPACLQCLVRSYQSLIPCLPAVPGQVIPVTYPLPACSAWSGHTSHLSPACLHCLVRSYQSLIITCLHCLVRSYQSLIITCLHCLVRSYQSLIITCLHCLVRSYQSLIITCLHCLVRSQVT